MACQTAQNQTHNEEIRKSKNTSTKHQNVDPRTHLAEDNEEVVDEVIEEKRGIRDLDVSFLEPVTKDIRVLVVDDDSTCVAIISATLKKMKYNVTITKSPIEALNMIREDAGSFDIVLTDVHMPEMSGFELLETCQKEEFDIPVILMSGDRKREIILYGLRCGALHFMVKPIDIFSLQKIWTFVYQHERKNVKARKTEVVNSKKPRLCWTPDLHSMFVRAVNEIGIDKAAPKKVQERLKHIPGLTREKIASHLQKYRTWLRKMANMQNGDSSCNNVEMDHNMNELLLSNLNTMITNRYASNNSIYLNASGVQTSQYKGCYDPTMSMPSANMMIMPCSPMGPIPAPRFNQYPIINNNTIGAQAAVSAGGGFNHINSNYSTFDPIGSENVHGVDMLGSSGVLDGQLTQNYSSYDQVAAPTGDSSATLPNVPGTGNELQLPVPTLLGNSTSVHFSTTEPNDGLFMNDIKEKEKCTVDDDKMNADLAALYSLIDTENHNSADDILAAGLDGHVDGHGTVGNCSLPNTFL